MLDLSILVPVLRRPGNILPLLDSFAAATSCEYEVVFLVSTNDREELRALQSTDRPNFRYLILPPHDIGDYAIKINHGYRHSTGEWMLLAADDVKPHRRWWENSEQFRSTHGVIGTQDMGNRRVRRGYHSTHTLVSRHYADTYGTIDEMGKVLHEGYPHAYVDDEFVATAKFRGQWAFSHASLIEHLHPDWGKSTLDSTYEKSKVSMSPGRALFISREHLWKT